MMTCSSFARQGYEHFGNDWEKIITWGKMDRLVDQVKRRFARIKTKQNAGAQGSERRSDDESAIAAAAAGSATVSPPSSPDARSEDEGEPPRKMQKTSTSTPEVQYLIHR